MKLPIAAAFAVLALAGAAMAQPPPVRIASDFEGNTSAPTAGEQIRSEAAQDALRSVQKASSQVQLACVADREKFCADAKTTFGAGRCLERHRKEINVACAAGLAEQKMAWSSPR